MLDLLVWAVIGPGCTEARQRCGDEDGKTCANSEEREACPGYDEEIQPLLNAECLECHGLAGAGGGYSVYQQADVWARNQDGVSRVVPGSDSCLFLTRARGGDHAITATDEALKTFTRWIVTCQANPLENDLVHARGWVNRASPDFHGKKIRDAGWDFSKCEECHGPVDDPAGGKVGKSFGFSCRTCHKNGPTACETCHGTLYSPAPPPDTDGNLDPAARAVGAHRIHLTAGPTIPTGFSCNECHVVPTDWRGPGHIFNADGSLKVGPAEVVLGPLAAQSLEDLPERRSAPPIYNPEAQTCANVYCHGGALGDSSIPPPVWNRVSTDPKCDRCHGDPPTTTHKAGWIATDCQICHGLVVDATLQVIDPSLHGDGKLTLGDGSKTCQACHGSAENPAPPTGLGGETDASDPGVGAHQTHLHSSTLAGKYDCAACHNMPTGDNFIAAVNAADHIDHLPPALVFPGGSLFTGIAARDNATPTYNAETRTCSGVYCHGSGEKLGGDTTAGLVRTLSWTDVGNDTVVCGSCHGNPPVGIGHPVLPGGTVCAGCHPLSMRADGSILIRPNGTSVHANGDVE